MKKLIIFLALAFVMCGCSENERRNNEQRDSNILYIGTIWDVVEINDTVISFVPTHNAKKDIEPIIINLNDF